VQGGRDAILKPVGYPSGSATYPFGRPLPYQQLAEPRASGCFTYLSRRLSHTRLDPRVGPSGPKSSYVRTLHFENLKLKENLQKNIVL
jgi:hypothetical protein